MTRLVVGITGATGAVYGVRLLQRLREAGVREEQLKNIRAPIGLDIGAVTPEEVALAIMAEIVAERRGATGTSLSAWRRKNI